MSRAAQIITEFCRDRSFAYPHSAEEYLAMAYDEVHEQMRQAQRDAYEANRKLRSTIEDRAIEILSGHDVEIKPTDDPTVWRFSLQPVRAYSKMLSAKPSRWDRDLLTAVFKEITRLVSASFERRIMELIEADRKSEKEATAR